MRERLAELWRRRPRADLAGLGDLQREFGALGRVAQRAFHCRDVSPFGEGPPTLVERALVAGSLRKLGGHLPAGLGPEDVIAQLIVRDDAAHIEDFLRHHLALGVRGVVVLDSGSRDETVELALRYAPVLVLRSTRPLGRGREAAQMVLQDWFGRRCWALRLDVRDRFDYPASDVLSLARLARYLEAQAADLLLSVVVDLDRVDVTTGLVERAPPAPLIAPPGVHSCAAVPRSPEVPQPHLHRLSMVRCRESHEPWHIGAQNVFGGPAQLADVTGVLWRRAAGAPPTRPDPTDLTRAGLLHRSDAFDDFVAEHGRQRKVFCVGFHKTGTTSMGTLLRHLGYAVVGSHRTRDRGFVADLAAGRLEELFYVADRASAFEDNPWPLVFRELDARYPGSRFILTVRDPERWIRSVVAHFGAQAEPDSPMRQLIYGKRAGDPRGHEATYLARYRAHIDAVRAHFARRPDDLLEVDVSDPEALERICRFLGHSVDLPAMPHDNRAARA